MITPSHMLISDKFWGPMEASQVDENRMFHCGMCSDNLTQVFHNIIGQHRHWPADEARKATADQISNP